jgi:hypothetical protein
MQDERATRRLLRVLLLLAASVTAFACGRPNAQPHRTTVGSESSTRGARPPASSSSPLPAGAQALAPHPKIDGPHSRYDFRCDGTLETLNATVCFDGFVPERLVPEIDEAKRHLRSARIGQRALPRDTRGVVLDGLRPGDCVEYQVDIDEPARSGNLLAGAVKVGKDVLLTPDFWLWTPDPRPREARATARFSLAPGVKVAVPWPRHEHGARFIPASAHVWKSHAALGRFAEKSFAIGGGRIDAAVLGAGFEHTDDVLDWLEREARSVASLYGRLPQPRIQVLLMPRPAGANSFGYTVRGGGASVALQLAHDADRAMLARDWTAAHELLHTGLPTIDHEAPWMFEGITTYYTAVVRGRGGGRGPHDGWWGLLDGFRRGKRKGGRLTLRDESRVMHQNGTYWRVYWAGAALALEIDVELRRRGLGSLEAALTTLASTSRKPTIQKMAVSEEARTWRAEELVARLDAITGSDICKRIVAKHLDDTAFPPLDGILGELGVRLDAQDAVVFDDQAPLVAIRRAIIP